MRITEPIIKFTKSDIILLNSLAIVTGIACGFITIGFRYLIALICNISMFGEFSFVAEGRSPMTSPLNEWMILVPAAGGLLTGLLIYFFAPEAKGHGVPEVMAAIKVSGGRIRPRVTLIKAVASAITIGTGGSSGREGPIVQIGSAAASSLAQLFKQKSRAMKILVGCGAAGGIAATFNTPIAGVIFAVEIVLMEFKTKSFIPLVISSVMATVISRHYLGSSPAFIVPTYTFHHPLELLFYLVLGLLAGLTGIMIIKSLYGFEDFYNKLRIPEWIKPVTGGSLMGLLFFKFRYVMGIGYQTMTDALNQNLAFHLMLILIIAKILAVSLTLGSGGSGGVFAPSLFIGCMLGGAFGFVVNYFFPTIATSYGAYAMVGMAAVFASISRATLTSIIILFEMTRDYHIILPLMFACVIADALSHLLQPDTIYTLKLKRKGINIQHDMESDYMGGITAKDIMACKVDSVNFNTTALEVSNLINSTSHHGFPILDDEGKLAGIVTEFDIINARKNRWMKKKIKDLPLRQLVVAYPDETLDSIVQKMLSEKVSHIPIIERNDQKKLLGCITRSDILNLRRRDT
ncbi:MAG: chloride channel protein [Acidobacteria bacterium]|nr:chloride channel protein [Acidobacteriota bacterium]